MTKKRFMQKLQGVVNPLLLYTEKGTWTTGGFYTHYIKLWICGYNASFDIGTHRGPKRDDYTDGRLRVMRLKYKGWLEEHKVILSF